MNKDSGIGSSSEGSSSQTISDGKMKENDRATTTVGNTPENSSGNTASSSAEPNNAQSSPTSQPQSPTPESQAQSSPAPEPKSTQQGDDDDDDDDEGQWVHVNFAMGSRGGMRADFLNLPSFETTMDWDKIYESQMAKLEQQAANEQPQAQQNTNTGGNIINLEGVNGLNIVDGVAVGSPDHENYPVEGNPENDIEGIDPNNPENQQEGQVAGNNLNDDNVVKENDANAINAQQNQSFAEEYAAAAEGQIPQEIENNEVENNNDFNPTPKPEPGADKNEDNDQEGQVQQVEGEGEEDEANKALGDDDEFVFDQPGLEPGMDNSTQNLYAQAGDCQSSAEVEDLSNAAEAENTAQSEQSASLGLG